MNYRRFLSASGAWLRRSMTVVAALALGGCVTPPKVRHEGDRVVFNPPELENIAKITRMLVSLGPATDPAEAALIAETAVRTGAECAERYGVNLSPDFHNMLVNRGLRPRGLCWQFTWDMAAALGPLKPKTFDYHWCVADWTEREEHNTIVVTARGGLYKEGITLDPWISSGVVTSNYVLRDKTHQWLERLPPVGAPPIVY